MRLANQAVIAITSVLLFLVSVPGRAGDLGAASSQALKDMGNFKIKERVIYLPSAQLHWMSYNKLKLVQHAGVLSRATRSSYSSTEVNSPVEVDKLRPLAKALHEDLVAKLQAAGWQVVPASDPAGAVAGLKPYGSDAASGLPMAKWNDGKYAVITPEGMAPADTQALDAGKALNEAFVAKLQSKAR